VTEIRECDECGGAFAPRREHARFCSAACRMAWHRSRLAGTGNLDGEADLAAETSALLWSIAAMTDSVQQLPAVRAWDQPQAFAIVAEAVWRTTIVDATLIRHYPETYDEFMRRQPAGQRRLVEGTLAGLRFVRNQMAHEGDHAGFVRQAALGATPGDGHGAGPVATWAWRLVPEPPAAAAPGGGQAWARARYQAYREFLVGRRIGETFGPAAAFLIQASAAAAEADIPGTASAAGH
jgi:hypothetical protein